MFDCHFGSPYDALATYRSLVAVLVADAEHTRAAETKDAKKIADALAILQSTLISFGTAAWIAAERDVYEQLKHIARKTAKPAKAARKARKVKGN